MGLFVVPVGVYVLRLAFMELSSLLLRTSVIYVQVECHKCIVNGKMIQH